MTRSEYIESLFCELYPMSEEKIKEYIPINLFDELNRIGYIDSNFFKVEIVDAIPNNEVIKIDVYYQQDTSICKLFEEMYSADYERYNWGFKFIIYEEIVYKILYGCDASA